jgi:Ca2+-transporting ATPase
MGLTGFLTAAAALIVFLDGLRLEPIVLARTHAFSVLVFAELFRSFGARSETKPVWKIPIVTNLKLAWVIGISIALQISLQHNHWLAGLFKTALLPWADLWILLTISLLPLLIIEAVKLASCSFTERNNKSPGSRSPRQA